MCLHPMSIPPPNLLLVLQSPRSCPVMSDLTIWAKDTCPCLRAHPVGCPPICWFQLLSPGPTSSHVPALRPEPPGHLACGRQRWNRPQGIRKGFLEEWLLEVTLGAKEGSIPRLDGKGRTGPGLGNGGVGGGRSMGNQ